MADLSRRLRQALVTWLGRLLAVRDTPEALARGLAVGFFFGVSFLWGLQIVLAVVVAHLLRGNKVIAAALTAVSNPLTSLPLYGVCYWVGQLLLGTTVKLPDLAQLGSLDDVVALGPAFFLTMFAGTTLVGLVGALVLYFSAHRIFPILQRWHGRWRGRHTHPEVQSGRQPGRSDSCRA
jgi:uncharacterized protein